MSVTITITCDGIPPRDCCPYGNTLTAAGGRMSLARAQATESGWSLAQDGRKFIDLCRYCALRRRDPGGIL